MELALTHRAVRRPKLADRLAALVLEAREDDAGSGGRRAGFLHGAARPGRWPRQAASSPLWLCPRRGSMPACRYPLSQLVQAPRASPMLQEIAMVRTCLLAGRASPLLNRLRVNFHGENQPNAVPEMSLVRIFETQ